MKKENIYLTIALASIAMYFYTIKKNGGQSKGVSGLNIDINTDRLMSGAMAYMGVNPIIQEPIKNAANKLINKLF